jgi:Zn/Cd-binding protein ZinT
MAITQAMATSFKQEILTAYHNFGTTATRATTAADTFKIALYTSSATLSASTTVYSSSNEITNTTGSAYVAGGVALTISQVPTTSGTTAFLSFNNATWNTASFTANGALIYNSTQGNRAVAVLAFGSDKTVSSGTFQIQFPTADATNAIIRIA